jgi:hypothetical protein
MPPINPQVRPRHKSTPHRKQKHRRRLEILRRAQTAQQRAGHPRLFDFRFGLQQGVGHGGSDVLMRGLELSDVV